MRASSAKAKGRRAAAEFQQLLLARFPELHPDDIRITPSGVNGEDLQLSPKARELLNFHFEIKNQERFNIWEALKQSKNHGKSKPVVVFKRNRTPFHVCMEVETFLDLIAG